MRKLEVPTMNSFDKNFLKKNNLKDFIRIGDYAGNDGIIAKLPLGGGIYVVVYKQLPVNMFIDNGTGGFFKGKDPNVSTDYLRVNWVDGTQILYIGKAGGADAKGKKSDSTLQNRIKTYLKFGSGNNVGHWGGRLIWQLEKSEDLLIYWRECSGEENPVAVEKQLLLEFEKHYKKLPFANLRR